MDYKNSGVDIEAGYKSVELMKKHVARTRNEGCLDDVGGFGGCFHAFYNRFFVHHILLTLPDLPSAYQNLRRML